MKKQIEEIREWFKDQLITANLELGEISEYTAEVIVDGYCLRIWIANEDFGIRTYDGSFIQLKFSRSEQIAIWKRLKPIVKLHKKEVLLKQIKDEYEKLKKRN